MAGWKLAIQGSRFFIPIYFRDYFDKDMCRQEIDCARNEQIGTLSCPSRVSRADGPVDYAYIQFIDVAKNPGFLDDIIRIVTATEHTTKL